MLGAGCLAARRDKGAYGHMQKRSSVDHMQSKRHSACVDQFRVNSDQSVNGTAYVVD